MSEEEIIKNLNELISWKGKNVEIRDYEIEAIQDLLDLYNKEKEKYKTEFKTSHYLQSELDQANAKLIKEKEKNKELEEALEEWVNGERIYFNYISKEK